MKPEGPVIRRAEIRVETVPLGEVHRLVEEHHYARGGPNTAVFRHGLFWEDRLVGAAQWLPPTKNAANFTTKDDINGNPGPYKGGDWRRVLTLSRLVIAPGVPKMAATLLLGASTRMIKRDGRRDYLLTFADKWRGHDGGIYRAAGWAYLGETAAENVYVNAEGRMMGRKRGPKCFTHKEMLEQGFIWVGRFSKHRFGKRLR